MRARKLTRDPAVPTGISLETNRTETTPRHAMRMKSLRVREGAEPAAETRGSARSASRVVGDAAGVVEADPRLSSLPTRSAQCKTAEVSAAVEVAVGVVLKKPVMARTRPQAVRPSAVGGDAAVVGDAEVTLSARPGRIPTTPPEAAVSAPVVAAGAAGTESHAALPRKQPRPKLTTAGVSRCQRASNFETWPALHMPQTRPFLFKDK
jgi:hypothetical protein